MTRSLVTSPDSQWAAVRTGREISLLAAGCPPITAKTELDADDVDLAMIGPPTALAAVTRAPSGNKIVLYHPPYLEAVARLDLEIPAKLAATTGPRLVVMSSDSMPAPASWKPLAQKNPKTNEATRHLQAHRNPARAGASPAR
jgi:hypothetical protein